MPNYNIDSQSIFTHHTLEKFEDFAWLFFSSRENTHEPATLRSDKARINKLCKIFGSMLISTIRHSDLLRWLMAMESKYKPKTTVEYLNLLKGIFRLAVHEKAITESPADALHVAVEPYSDPDTFFRPELETMSVVPTQFISDHNLIMSNVMAGARMCEWLSVKCSGVDLIKGTVRINSNQVLGDAKSTKNKYSERYIEMSEPLKVILTEQMKLSANNPEMTIKERLRKSNRTKTYQDQYLFVNPRTGLPYRDVKDFSQRVWKQFMADASALHQQRHGKPIRYRGISQLRHTYASQALSAGANPVWLAKQLGHANTDMIFKNYAKWIKEDAQIDNNQAVSHQFSRLIGETKDPIIVGSLKKRAELKSLMQVQQALIYSEDDALKQSIENAIRTLEAEVKRFEELNHG
ncbi:tyrosine-type recombinase/integrase [Vibrio parahaemolyticus]|uniref:tyrosine-type recombinase/integrase n=1 Tax=Vibrio parahaemolyticus TaxID=670 RepID=UPI002256AA6B|nr:tyrosine-type recombinase/integrase [Vibrio parahaemolyticus]MCX4121834.1 tyrosine-type recombinase/integrase [Vibrio parahaemolyticus]